MRRTHGQLAPESPDPTTRCAASEEKIKHESEAWKDEQSDAHESIPASKQSSLSSEAAFAVSAMILGSLPSRTGTTAGPPAEDAAGGGGGGGSIPAA